MLKPQTQPTTRTLDIHGAFVRRTDLSGASLRGANLAGADATNAIFRDADFQDAVLDGTILRGADLTGAKNLSVEQLAEAIIDDETILPRYIDRTKIRDARKSGRA
jgi:uncharacterized protein YjbI with pentapeptide repeats